MNTGRNTQIRSEPQQPLAGPMGTLQPGELFHVVQMYLKQITSVPLLKSEIERPLLREIEVAEDMALQHIRRCGTVSCRFLVLAQRLLAGSERLDQNCVLSESRRESHKRKLVDYLVDLETAAAGLSNICAVAGDEAVGGIPEARQSEVEVAHMAFNQACEALELKASIVFEWVPAIETIVAEAAQLQSTAKSQEHWGRLAAFYATHWMSAADYVLNAQLIRLWVTRALVARSKLVESNMRLGATPTNQGSELK